MAVPRIPIPQAELAAFCAKWRVVEFSLFGSVLRDDFRPDSDVDVLVAFAPEARWSLFDMVDMQDELQALFGRKVDLIEKDAVRNPYRRREILATSEVLIAS